MKATRKTKRFAGSRTFGPSISQSIVIDSGHPANPRLHGRFALHLLRRKDADCPRIRYAAFLYAGPLRFEIGGRG